MKKLANDIVDLVNATHPEEARLAVHYLLDRRLRELMVHADSELSAIAHGRPPGDRDENYKVAIGFRNIYEGRS